MSRKSRSGGRKRSYRWLVIPVLVLVTGVVAYYIFTASGTTVGASSLLNQPVSSTILSELNGVSVNTLSAVGAGGSDVDSPTAISTSAAPLTFDSKPEVLYMGGEYCPYCAAERWAMIIALDKFGSFTGVEYMQSTSTDIYPDTSTFTFVSANYSSSYVSFVTVEEADRAENPLQTATSSESSLLSTYDTGGTIPFVDFGNKYVITSAQYSPIALRVGDTAAGAPLNWTQIASQLNNPNSAVAQNVDAAANRFISTICKIDGGAPTSVCSESFASLSSYTAPPSGASQPLAFYAAPAEIGPSVAPVRSTYSR